MQNFNEAKCVKEKLGLPRICYFFDIFWHRQTTHLILHSELYLLHFAVPRILAMNLRLVLLAITLSLSLPLSSQEEPLLYERFSQPSREWPLGEYKAYSARIDTSEGELVYDHAYGSPSRGFTRELYLEDAVRFSIEGKVKMLSPAPGQAVGLCWSADKEGQNYYAFQIRPEGEYRLVAVRGGIEQVIRDWQSHRRIRPAGEYNTLRIEKKGNTLTALINQKAVAQIKYRRFFGKRQGFVFSGRGSWRCDYFRVEHPPVPILLAEGPVINAACFPLDSTVADSALNETAPRMSPDGKTLYFTVSPLDSGLRIGAPWFTHWQGDTIWTPPALISAVFGQRIRQELFYIAPDHKSLWLGSEQGVAIAYQGRDTLWQTPIPLDIPGLDPGIGHPSFALSSDQEVMILALEREDSYGKRDLYVSFRRGNEWSEPQPLGSDVNTWGEEFSPYLLSDNKTLYFASSGRPGYGEVDVYVTTRQSNTWTDWSEPRNLGPGINGPYWDAWYLPLKNPRRAYMSKQDSLGNFDLYSVRIPRDLELMGLARVFGQIRNQKTGARLNGTVHFEAIAEDSLSLDFETLSARQGYQGLLPRGKAYEVHATVLGFFPLVDTLDIRPLSKYREIKLDLWVKPLEIGQTIQLKNVYFKRAQAELLPASFAELDRLVLLMRALPALSIEIQGHTDNIGRSDELQLLSETRAEVVRNYLTRHGIEPGRTSSRGFGSSQPIASNENPATRHLNRRVEFRIISR
jgi:outer membrane protein OmpA-like peptidoglycan-associated protein